MKAKKLILIVPILMLMSTTYGQKTNKQKFKKLEWLLGEWIRTNPDAGQSGYETWTKTSELKLSGKGVTLKGKETIFLENLELVIKGNDIFYSVMVTGEKQPTYFRLTALNANGFTCENPKHDFPKKITYQRNGKYVKAVISGNGQSMDYNFVAIKQITETSIPKN